MSWNPLDDVLGQIAEDVQEVKRLERARGDTEPRTGSRYVGPNATASAVAAVADGGSIPQEERRIARRSYATDTKAGSFGGSMLKALAEGTGASGGFLVPVEHATSIMGMMRANSVVMAMSPTIVPVRKSWSLVALSSSATAYYTAENAPITPSEATFSETALLSPKNLSALVPVSLRLMRDAAENPSIDELLRRDLAEILQLRQDLAFLRGTGTGGEPRGIVNHAGLASAPSLGADGGLVSYDHLHDVLGSLRSANATFSKPGWLMHPRTLTQISKLKASTGQYLSETGLLKFSGTGAAGELLGYPYRTTTMLPINLTQGASTDTSEIIFSSDWQEAFVGENEDLEIQTSYDATYTSDGGTTWNSAYQQQQVVFRASLTQDFALRRPGLFVVLKGVR